MQIRPRHFLNLIIAVAAIGGVFLGWRADSSTLARRLFALEAVAASVVLVAMALYQLRVRGVAFYRLYPLGLVAVGVLLRGLYPPPTTPTNVGIISSALVIVGLLLYYRNRLRGPSDEGARG
jgi:hypothetical protein